MAVKTEKDAEAQPQHDAVQQGDGQVDVRVARAVQEGVAARTGVAAEGEQDGDGHVFPADAQDFRVGREEAEDLVREKVYRGGEEAGEDAHEFEGLRHDAPHPFVFAGADVLADHGGAGRVDGVGQHVEGAVQFMADAGEGGNGDAERVDPGIDEHFGQLDGGVLEGHGEAQGHEQAHELPVPREEEARRQGEVVFPAVAQQEGEAEDAAQSLAEHRGEGRTAGAHAQQGHEEQVQDDVQEGRKADEVKRMLGVAHAA